MMTEPTGPTEHLNDPAYWRGLYSDAIEVGRRMMDDAREAAAFYRSAALCRETISDEEDAKWLAKIRPRGS